MDDLTKIDNPIVIIGLLIGILVVGVQFGPMQAYLEYKQPTVEVVK